MDFYAIASTVCVLLPLIVILAAFGYSRGRYRNFAHARAFLVEGGALVLNTGVPYPIPVENIDCVELRCSGWELENRLSYGLTVKVIRKDGTAKSCYYKGCRTAKLALPSDMAAEIEAHGLRCRLVEQ